MGAAWSRRSPDRAVLQGQLAVRREPGAQLKTPHAHTVWWTEPDAYSARCSSANGANVLEISPRHGAVKPPTPAWGLHLIDANVALGNLVAIVNAEAAAYVRRGGK